MELTNEFTVDVPVEQAWAVLTDLERIAPCMPGAQLQEVSGDDYLGVVRVKVGPVTAEYRGKAQFLERDTAAHKAVLRAEGRETRGQGNASATITAQLESSGSATHVSVVTDLSISGRVAQFGRGVLADVSNKLLGQFVQQLETTVLNQGASAQPQPPGEPEAAGEPEPAGQPEAAAEPAGAGEPEVAGEPEPAGQPEPAGLAEPLGQADAPGPAEPAHQPDGPGPAGASQGAVVEPAPVNLVRVVGPVILKRLLPPAMLAAAVLVWLRLRKRRSC
jgi:uncharacterized protein